MMGKSNHWFETAKIPLCSLKSLSINSIKCNSTIDETFFRQLQIIKDVELKLFAYPLS